MKLNFMIWILMILCMITFVSALQVNSSTEIYSFDVTNMQANESSLNCSPAYIRFSANITNYQYIDHVLFTIQGNDYVALRSNSYFYYNYYKVQNPQDVNGTLDWTIIKIYDVSSGIAQVFPNIHITVDCLSCSYTIIDGLCSITDLMNVQHIGNGAPGCINYNTTDSCNYCSANITQTIITPCNGTKEVVSYSDPNYSACCGITGLSTDCLISFLPYNETQIIDCSFTAGDFTLQCDPQPIIQDRIECLINLNQNKNFKCWTTVRQQGINGSNPDNYLQVNPVKTEFQGTVLLAQKAETREYFTITNGVGGVYYTSKSIVGDTQYLLGVKCVDDSGNTKLAEQPISPVYGNLNSLPARAVWAKQNIMSIIGYVLVIIIVLILLVIAYEELVKPR